ncbi:hypothetical protein [Peribacillus alkalitolerans]|uniref:hypothetical protein n=1 Tax=Peribacillus alkalitolerans TaxID=1550385 RepID=UPI0013D53346|nr:hypothetical protein [Peribacillus alkalitolerans]
MNYQAQVADNREHESWNVCSIYQQPILFNDDSPLRIGLWSNRGFSWEFPNKQQVQSDFSILSLNKNEEIEHISFSLTNQSQHSKLYKIIVQYLHTSEDKSLAFYSPAKNAILHYSSDSIVMLGGVLNGRGLSQYCIRDYEADQSKPIFRSKEEGFLPISPLASGSLCSLFTLEMELAPGKTSEGMIWTITATSNDEMIGIEERLLNKL